MFLANEELERSVMQSWKKLKKKLTDMVCGGDLQDVSCDLHFHDGSDRRKPLWQEFKRAFNIEAQVPTYLDKGQQLYEVGKGTFRGMEIEAYGPHKQNPHYVPETEEQKELRWRLDSIKQYGPVLLEMLTHSEIVTIDRDKAIAFCRAHGFDWDRCYGLILKTYGRKA